MADPYARRLASVVALGAVTVAAACSPVDIAVRAGLTAGVVIAQERAPEDAARDELLDAAIAEALFRAHVDDLFLPVNVDVMEGRVLLTGHVADRETAERAVALVRRVAGVRETIDELRADDLSLLDRLRDHWIDARLGLRLFGDGGVNSVDFHVSVVGGFVYVLGIARDRAERDRVAALARDTDGVRGVVMHVITTDDPRRSAAR